MFRSAHRLTVGLVVSLSLGCSARGGGNTTIGATDAGSSTDAVRTTDDARPAMDLGTPPTDNGVTRTDAGKEPVDVGTPTDRGARPSCGDGICQDETCTSCPTDCGACAPRCGDGACNGSETCASCAADCGECRVDAGPRDVGTVDNSITRPCSGSDDPDGTNSECSWVLSQTVSCTPGVTVTLGCTGGASTDGGACVATLGSCGADPMMRVCPGSGTQCTQAGRIPATSTTGYSEDDACGTCPVARFVCPSGGAMTVYQRSYYGDRTAVCVIARG